MANVTVRKKKLANNKYSLYLDYFPPIINPKTGKESRREFLKLQIHATPKDQIEKTHNKQTIEFAEIIRAKRLVQIRNQEYGLKDNVNLSINFVAFYETVVEEKHNTVGHSNYLAWKSSLKYFLEFFGTKIQSHNLNQKHVDNYREFLLNTNNLRVKDTRKLARNTASTYFKHFITVLKKAYKNNLLITNLAEDAIYIKEEQTHREYLTEEELVLLWKTNIKIEKIKHMAIFAALTGLRFSDIINLKWETVYNDKHQGHYIRLKEQKTGNLTNHPISKNAYEILKKQDTTNGQVFTNIKYSQVTRPLKEWIKLSGINKNISFHNFRHSYASLQLANGTDIYTVSKLLGHKNLSTTQIYTKVMDKNKIKAANRINLDLDGLPTNI
ncbi:site-specific integrase [Cellulophaga baltica]|uniref:tyrosine-type recombinase/integrase n=1 Tax=Cellulophaga baltica TaxID=76594 RepID=UPI002148F093|nr:site-specific integrase [Cellulophaga baltica]MCR1026656.1 site-specific integrase [Cellulophaga baltica]